MSWTTASIPDLSGRLALVTGASSGLGLETCRALAAHGATVVMACRSRQRGEAARQALLTPTGGRSADPGSGGPSNGTGATATPDHTPAEAASPWGALDLLDLDLADLASVRSAATEVAERYGRLDLLINNAGVMAPPRTLGRDGFELQFATNHLGHFALTALLRDALDAAPAARVVAVSSLASRQPALTLDDVRTDEGYDPWRAYARSKLANLVFALELQRRLVARASRTISIAAHPGVAATNLSPRTGRVADALTRVVPSAASGARMQLFAATDPSLTGGEFVGPRVAQIGGAPTLVRPTAVALDAALADRLWEVSTGLTGVTAG